MKESLRYIVCQLALGRLVKGGGQARYARTCGRPTLDAPRSETSTSQWDEYSASAAW